MITYEDVKDWKSQPVTKWVFDHLQERIRSMEEILGVNAGRDPLQDRYWCGAIAAHRDVLNTTYEELTND